MRYIGFSSALVLTLLSGVASQAADLPRADLRPALPPPTERLTTWDGFNLGVFGGYGWASTSSTIAVTSATLAAVPAIIPTIEAKGSNKVNWAGALVGVSAGYDISFGRYFVAGLEGDIAWTSMAGATANGGLVPVFNGAFGFVQKMRADWLATARARVGVALTDRILAYATGGAALTDLRHSSDFADVFQEYEYFRLGAARLGWTAGVGLQYAFSPNWSAKAEYLHAEFGGAYGIGGSVLTNGTIAWVQHSVHATTMDMVRFGVNYRFAGEQAALVAKY